MDIQIETEIRTDYYIIIDGTRFDLVDLYETLDEISVGNTWICNEYMARFLKEKGVIEYTNSTMGTELGENYDEFCMMIAKEIDKLDGIGFDILEKHF